MVSEGFTDASGRVSIVDPELQSDWSTNLWRTCPLAEYMHDPSIGVMIEERWTEYDTTDVWVLTQATTGAATLSTALPGVLELDSNSATTGQGAQIQRDYGWAGSAPGTTGIIPAAGTKIWAEFGIKIVDTFDGCELFVGVAANDTTIIASSAMNAQDYIGWECVTDDGVLLFDTDQNTTGTTSACATIAEDTFIKLGFYIDGVTSCQQFVNGVATGTAHATANIPIVMMTPSFVCQTAGTVDPIMHIRPFRIFQTYA
jgi:hypothetical protein